MEQEDGLETTESLREKAIATFNPIFLERIQEVDLKILEMNELELEKVIELDIQDYLIRKRFWEIAESNFATGNTGSSMASICEGIIPKTNFYKRFINNHKRLAWMLQPISKNQDLIDESFFFTLKKVRNEILTMPVTEKSAPIILKALEFFANRSMGPMLQKIEQRSMNVTVDGNKAMREAINPEEMQARFVELQAKLTALPSTTVIVDDPE